jgi:hypothetical protein
MKNLLSDLIKDDVFEILFMHKITNEKLIREYRIRTKYRKMREAKISSLDALKALAKEYGENLDAIRKIVYWKPGNDKGLSPGAGDGDGLKN